MASAVRSGGGRYENRHRAFEADREAQRRQLTMIFTMARINATPLLWGHSGTLSANDLARLVNFVSHSELQVPEVWPEDYGVRAG